MTLMPDANALIDVRDEDAFARGHVLGAASVELETLELRMHELPARHIAIDIVCDDHQLNATRERFEAKGYSIDHLWVWQSAETEQLKKERGVETGPASARLWQPAHVVELFVEQFAKPFRSPSANAPSIGLDFACGCGREAVYLAMAGWQMTGIDYLPMALEKSSRLAKQHQVSLAVENQDLEADLSQLQARQPVDLICIARYLHRPMLPLLADLLNPGGFLLYQTFMQGCEKIGRPRNPKFLLAPDELRSTFSDLDVLVDTVHLLDDGRPTNVFIARKPL